MARKYVNEILLTELKTKWFRYQTGESLLLGSKPTSSEIITVNTYFKVFHGSHQSVLSKYSDLQG